MQKRGLDHEPDDLLDLFSTSPTKEDLCSDFSSQKCSYRAPYFAYKSPQNAWAVTQGNCHHWDCPRCGIGRAKQEYGRIVEGCRILAKKQRITFITITCKGRELTHEQAEAGYLGWTNRFLDACRAKCKRSGSEWVYVQVTERQKRGHPHSHILTTFDPSDTYSGSVSKWVTFPDGSRRSERKAALRSDWLQDQVIRSGLGKQYDISFVQTVEGASRYVAKYLFKPTIFETVWPKGWKRVRYSQSFPKLAERDTDAFVLLKRADWRKLIDKADAVTVDSYNTLEMCEFQLRGSGIKLKLREKTPKE